MGLHDLDARFEAVSTDPNTIARQAVQAIHEAARKIDALVVGEPYQLTTVVQALESAAHQSRLYLDFTDEDQPGTAVKPEPDGDEVPGEPAEPYADLDLAELRAEIEIRNNKRNEADRIPTSGTKAELRQRLRNDDTGQLQS